MKYNRILLKLSGEVLGGDKGAGIDEKAMAEYAGQIASVVKSGVQVAVVVGGGNIFRGLSGVGRGFDRVKGDQMGMLATVINSIGMVLALKDAGVKAECFTSVPMEPLAKYYMRDDADRFLAEGGVAVIAGGTGNPFFTTDSAASLRACELRCDALFKGTKVDGVYDSDPKKNPGAVRYEAVSYDKVISDGLKVMDLTAFAMCKENDMPVVVFDVTSEGNLEKVVAGTGRCTTVGN